MMKTKLLPQHTPREIKYKVNENGCHEITSYSKTKHGYYRITRDSKRWYAHRYIYTVANGPIPEGLVVMHKCDNPSCINLEHLRLGTPSENSLDMHQKGRNVVSYWKRPIKTNQIRSIRKSTGITLSKLAKEIGFSSTYLHQVETHKANGSSEMMKRISEVLNVDLEELWTQEEE